MDALDRMFHVLVRTIRAKHPAFLTAPLTVADLYQDVMPYRHFRRELDLETNQEYEFILMELLTGARGYLDVDERLRDQLGKELASPSPEPSRVREFADAHLSLNAAAAASVAGGRVSGETTQREARTGTVPTPSSSFTQIDEARCRYCGGDLPSGRIMNFCPHCGQNLQVLNCPACGAEVEAGWKFCVACGKAVA
jgi:hypothetical protein